MERIICWIESFKPMSFEAKKEGITGDVSRNRWVRTTLGFCLDLQSIPKRGTSQNTGSLSASSALIYSIFHVEIRANLPQEQNVETIRRVQPLTKL